MNRRSFAKLTALAAARFALLPPPPAARRFVGQGAGRPQFNVRAFGARGDGTTDDKEAFWTAIDNASRVGGSVVVPVGTYRLTGTLRLPSGISIEGQGALSILKSDGNPIVIWCTSVRDVEVHGLEIIGKFAHGVFMQQSSSISVTGCHIAGATLPRFNYAAGVYVIESTSILIEGCRLDSNGLDGAFVSSDIQCDGTNQRSHHIRIINNECHSTNVTTNIRCYDTSYSEIRENHVSGARLMRPTNSGYGIALYQIAENEGSTLENTVANNVVSHTQGSGIYLNRCHHSRVISNSIEDVGSVQDDNSLPVAGVALNQSEFVEIADNHISQTGRAGISIASNRTAVGHVQVRHNEIAHAAGFGIHLRGTLVDIKVVDNSVSDTNGGIGNTYPDAEDGIEIAGNVISQTRGGTPGISLGSATRSTIRANTLRDCGGLDLDLTLRDAASKVIDNVQIRKGRPVTGTDQFVRISRP